jgi:hypothetical protein
MRSSTTFFIFIGLIVLIVIVGMISSASRQRDPIIRAAETFLSGIKDNNAEVIIKVLDAELTEPMTAGARLTSIKFKAITLGTGSFTKRPEVEMMYTDLATLKLDTGVHPMSVPIDKPTATLSCGVYKLYMHQVGTDWKVFYVDKPEKKQ